MKTLNIVGCGNVGRTLGRLWTDRQVFRIGDVLNRSLPSARSAVDFMGAGRPVDGIAGMVPADLYLIATPDDRLVSRCRDLASSDLLRAGSIVFHLSGATRSAEFAPARDRGAQVASVHPVRSFADPSLSVETFAGTPCGAEGDAPAVEALSRAFEAIGGWVFAIDPRHKEIYHAASVFCCNYLTALFEIAVEAYARAGIPRDTAMEIMGPIARGTVDNVLALGTARALTGPIARGDQDVVARQIAATGAWREDYGDLYKRLGRVALALSRRQGTAGAGSLAALDDLLGS